LNSAERRSQYELRVKAASGLSSSSLSAQPVTDFVGRDFGDEPLTKRFSKSVESVFAVLLVSCRKSVRLEEKRERHHLEVGRVTIQYSTPLTIRVRMGLFGLGQGSLAFRSAVARLRPERLIV
jgi:hypothetical protein